MKDLNTQQQSGVYPIRQRGFSLVELMVSLVLGLILIYGVSEIYVNSKATYNVNEEMSRMQENARFSFDLMVPTVRQAGFTGCIAIGATGVNDIRKPPITDYDIASIMAGHEYTGPSWSPALPTGLSGNVLANTDVLTIQSSIGCDAHLVGNMHARNANIQISPNNSCGFVAGDPILITDCNGSDLFKATNIGQGADRETIAHSNKGNTTNFLSKLYFEDAELVKPTSTTYYIGLGASQLPALRRMDNVRGVDEELVEGVESMQVLYGLDTDLTPDSVVDRYVKADAIPVGGSGWDRVIVVRINLLVRSIGQAATTSSTYKFDGIDYGADRFLRQEYSTSIQLRNRSLLP